MRMNSNTAERPPQAPRSHGPRVARALLLLAMAGLQAMAVAAPAASRPGAQAGIQGALACEAEIDDDLGQYEECLGHQANTWRRQPAALAGLHFQAWIMSDLAARQGAGRAELVRRQHRLGLARELRRAGLSLEQLCRLRGLDCGELRGRLRQSEGPMPR